MSSSSNNQRAVSGVLVVDVENNSVSRWSSPRPGRFRRATARTGMSTSGRIESMGGGRYRVVSASGSRTWMRQVPPPPLVGNEEEGSTRVRTHHGSPGSSAARATATTGQGEESPSPPPRRVTRSMTRASQPSPPETRAARRRRMEAAGQVPKAAPPSSSSSPPAAATRSRKRKTPPSPEVNCCICMSRSSSFEKSSINGCQHLFCFGCIEQWAERENTCPLCKERFTKISRIHKPTKRRTARVKYVSDKTQQPPSSEIMGLFMGGNPTLARLIFSELDRMTESGPAVHVRHLMPSHLRAFLHVHQAPRQVSREAAREPLPEADDGEI